MKYPLKYLSSKIILVADKSDNKFLAAYQAIRCSMVLAHSRVNERVTLAFCRRRNLRFIFECNFLAYNNSH